MVARAPAEQQLFKPFVGEGGLALDQPFGQLLRRHGADALQQAAIFLAQTQDATIRENRFSRNGTTLAVEAGSSGVRFQGNRIELESPRPENLAAKGVASARITTISFGKDRPVDPASTEEAWAKNRNAMTSVK